MRSFQIDALNSLEEAGQRQADDELLAAQRLEFLKSTLWPNLSGRFRNVSLNTFEEHGPIRDRPRQRSVLEGLRQLNLAESIQSGQNILFIGPVGVGKDHLMHSMMRQVFIPLDGGIMFKGGANLRVELRDAAKGEPGREDAIVDAMVASPLLCLSDPAPIGGDSLSGIQADCLYRVADARWTQKRPIWLTMNLCTKHTDTQGKRVFTAPVWDRLIDGALIVRCNWPSYREAEQVIQ